MARKRDPQTGQLLPEGVHPVVSERTGKVTYRARISYGPSHDRRHIGETFKTASAAIDWRLRNLLAVNHGEVIDPSAVTCNEYFYGWLSRKAKRGSAGRANTLQSSWEKYAAPVVGDMRVQSVRRSHMQHIVEQMEAAALAESTINMYLVGFSDMFTSTIEDRIISSTPCTKLVVTAQEKRDVKPVWTPAQLRVFLDSQVEHEFYPIWAIMVGTLCRISEALAVFREDINPKTNVVAICRTVAVTRGGGLQIENRTKSGKHGRTVTVERWVMNALASLPVEQGRLFEPIIGIDGDDRLRYRLRVAAEKNDLPPITPHGLRHAAATAMVMNGVEEAIVQEILGHSHRSTTKIYVHVNDDDKRKGTSALAAVLGFGEAKHDNMSEISPNSIPSASELRQDEPEMAEIT